MVLSLNPNITALFSIVLFHLPSNMPHYLVYWATTFFAEYTSNAGYITTHVKTAKYVIKLNLMLTVQYLFKERIKLFQTLCLQWINTQLLLSPTRHTFPHMQREKGVVVCAYWNFGFCYVRVTIISCTLTCPCTWTYTHAFNRCQIAPGARVSTRICIGLSCKTQTHYLVFAHSKVSGGNSYCQLLNWNCSCLQLAEEL